MGQRSLPGGGVISAGAYSLSRSWPDERGLPGDLSKAGMQWLGSSSVGHGCWKSRAGQQLSIRAGATALHFYNREGALGEGA